MTGTVWLPPLTALDERGGLGVALDVDLVVGDAGLVQLQLQPAAVAAPGRRVHRHVSHARFNPRGGPSLPSGVAVRMGRCAHPLDAGLRVRGPGDRAGSRRRAAGRRHRARADRCACWPAPAPARPAPSPGGSRTWCRPGTSAPARCSRSPSPPGPPGSCGPGCARSASPGCRPAPSTPPRCASCATSGRASVGGTPWPLLEGKLRVVGQAAARLRAETDAESLRDFAGEIEWAKASLISPDDYPAAVARLRRSTPGAGRAGGRRLRRLRGAEEPGGAARLRRPAAAHRGRAGGAAGTSPRSSGTATAASWSTSTRTSRRCSSGCWTPGSARATTSPWSATPTRRSTPSPVPPRATCWTSHAGSRRPCWCDCTVTTGRPRRWSPRPTS